jgi:hypothetical protein
LTQLEVQLANTEGRPLHAAVLDIVSPRHYAEHSGYWVGTNFLKEESKDSGEITFYDSVSGKPLFVAPRGRSWASFVKESKAHGWPSFRDAEVRGWRNC